MYTKGQLEGIMLSLARPEITVFKSNVNGVKYCCRIRVVLRSTNLEFLAAIQRSLHQHMIKSILKEKENKQRVSPILIVGNRLSIKRLLMIVPAYVPNSYGDWAFLNQMLTAMEENKHLDEDGILEMKEWYDANKEKRKADIDSR